MLVIVYTLIVNRGCISVHKDSRCIYYAAYTIKCLLTLEISYILCVIEHRSISEVTISSWTCVVVDNATATQYAVWTQAKFCSAYKYTLLCCLIHVSVDIAMQQAFRCVLVLVLLVYVETSLTRVTRAKLIIMKVQYDTV
jgi:hypothetical protein